MIKIEQKIEKKAYCKFFRAQGDPTNNQNPKYI